MGYRTAAPAGAIAPPLPPCHTPERIAQLLGVQLLGVLTADQLVGAYGWLVAVSNGAGGLTVLAAGGGPAVADDRTNALLTSTRMEALGLAAVLSFARAWSGRVECRLDSAWGLGQSGRQGCAGAHRAVAGRGGGRVEGEPRQRPCGAAQAALSSGRCMRWVTTRWTRVSETMDGARQAKAAKAQAAKAQAA